MATRVPPALNLAVLCSYVDLDADDRPFSLHEPLYALGIAPDARGKLPAPEFVLVVQLDDEHAIGTFWFTAEARTASNIVLPNGRLIPQEATFDGNADPMRPRDLVFTFRGLVFPEPGRYHFHVMCNHTSLHGRDPISSPPCLRVLPGEANSGG
ncbi:MAG: hypothetical protein J0I06_01115 [Planctomycetes bacterium]|nr:hypothetical protein [Planctomycetota bacterium]